MSADFDKKKIHHDQPNVNHKSGDLVLKRNRVKIECSFGKANSE